MVARKKINEVFTPRKSEVNEVMYIKRPELEGELLDSLESDMHSFLYGESGNGKSWLYKNVLSNNNIPYIVINCGLLGSDRSIKNEIYRCVTEPGTSRKIGYVEDKQAELNAVLAKSTLKHSGEFTIHQEDILMEAFQTFSKKAKGKKIIVLENMERLYHNQELMNEMAGLILLLDDQQFAKYDINFLLVALPGGVMDYYRETKNHESVTNRIEEISKVGGFDTNQVLEFVETGMSQLQVDISSADLLSISRYIKSVTLGVAQRVHEYCSVLSKEIEKNSWRFDDLLKAAADERWLKLRLRQSYQVIERHLCQSPQADLIRYQVLYCISTIDVHQFNASDVDRIFDHEFRHSKRDDEFTIYYTLVDLTKTTTPLLTKIPDSEDFSIRDPRYLMCLKVMLVKDNDTEELRKKRFKL